MASERTYPCLPCRDLDEAITFYEALGFRHTFRQLNPNPYEVVVREDLQIHLFGMKDFNPADSYGSVIVVVPDPDALYQTFATGLRAAYKKLPVAGIPRILRPRKKSGTVRGFSVVDVGGNWLRISKLGDTEAEVGEERAVPACQMRNDVFHGPGAGHARLLQAFTAELDEKELPLPNLFLQPTLKVRFLHSLLLAPRTVSRTDGIFPRTGVAV